MKALIVEDDLTSRLMLQEYLKLYGTVQVAADGNAAVEAMRQALQADQPYDVILLDIMMPGMDGHQALKNIRALEKEAGVWPSYAVKIVMTTTLLNDSQSASAAYGSLCDAYLTKPVDKTKLLAKLREMLIIK
jgi:two-component system, chemotaxis family, chemotaxis protein CheY